MRDEFKKAMDDAKWHHKETKQRYTLGVGTKGIMEYSFGEGTNCAYEYLNEQPHIHIDEYEALQKEADLLNKALEESFHGLEYNSDRREVEEALVRYKKFKGANDEN